MSAADLPIVQHIVNAWDCCGTCAGGVLASYVRDARAEAWGEGWDAAWSPMSMHSRNSGPNPYRHEETP